MAYSSPSACRVDWLFKGPNGATAVCVQHYNTADASDYDLASLGVLAGELVSWFATQGWEGTTGPNARAQMNNRTRLDRLVLTQLEDTDPAQLNVPVGLAGVQSGNPLPNETALVVSWYTGTPGPRRRGRNFWPGVDPDQIDTNGQLTAAALAAYGTMFQSLLDGLESAGNNILLIKSDAANAAYIVTDLVVRSTLHHQRRRNQ